MSKLNIKERGQYNGDDNLNVGLGCSQEYIAELQNEVYKAAERLEPEFEDTAGKGVDIVQVIKIMSELSEDAKTVWISMLFIDSRRAPANPFEEFLRSLEDIPEA